MMIAGNTDRTLCKDCAPDLQEEFSSIQVDAAISDARLKASQVDYVSPDKFKQTIVASCSHCGAKGGEYHANYLSTPCHVYFGSVTGATPDDRRAHTPLSDGISPVQGADRRGPTAVIKSAGRMDHARCGGTLLNQKFTPSLLQGEEDITHLAQFVRSYFALGGHHIQFNVVTAGTLRAAQAHPEQYRDLIVRVAGYSDYFCDLTKPLQDEIISRTEHEGFSEASAPSRREEPAISKR